MVDSLQYRNYSVIEIVNKSVRASMIGPTPFIHATFEINRYWEKNFPGNSNSILFLNCYGNLKVFDMVLGKYDSPTFFKSSSIIPEFRVQLYPEIIGKIENKRLNRDINMVFELEVLCAFCTDYRLSDISTSFEQHLTLSANIPKSKWLEDILPQWDYFNANEVIIPLISLSNYPSIKKHIGDSRKAFANNNYRETLTSVFRAIEALHKLFGYDKFNSFLDNFRETKDSKDQQIASMFKQIISFLNMARHDNTEISGTEETKVFNRDDAKLALTYGQMIVDYVLNNQDAIITLKK